MEWISTNWLVIFTTCVALALLVYVVKSYLQGTLISEVDNFEPTKPHPFRELSDDEKSVLEERLALLTTINSYSLPLGVIGSLLLIGAVFIQVNLIDISTWLSLQKEPLITSGYLLGTITLSTIVYTKLQITYYKSDLHSKVYKVIGKVILGTDPPFSSNNFLHNRIVKKYHIVVEGEGFYLSNSEDQKLYDELAQQDPVAVEYSPKTKHMWSIKKVS